MSLSNKHWLAVPVVGMVIALGGCAAPEGGSTTASRAEPSKMGGSGSPYMSTALSPGNCMKYGEAPPPECERILGK